MTLALPGIRAERSGIPGEEIRPEAITHEVPSGQLGIEGGDGDGVIP